MKAINTLNIEKSQLEERIKGINEEVNGLETIISDKKKQVVDYQAQVDELNEALRKLS